MVCEARETVGASVAGEEWLFEDSLLEEDG